jgi:hypothetical protein
VHGADQVDRAHPDDKWNLKWTHRGKRRFLRQDPSLEESPGRKERILTFVTAGRVRLVAARASGQAEILLTYCSTATTPLGGWHSIKRGKNSNFLMELCTHVLGLECRKIDSICYTANHEGRGSSCHHYGVYVGPKLFLFSSSFPYSTSFPQPLFICTTELYTQ